MFEVMHRIREDVALRLGLRAKDIYCGVCIYCCVALLSLDPDSKCLFTMFMNIRPSLFFSAELALNKAVLKL